MKHIFVLGIFMIFMSCKKDNKPEETSAQNIVDRSIEVSGGHRFEYSTIAFDFRDKIYKARRYGNAYNFQRAFELDNDSIVDILDNNGFVRFVNNERVVLKDSLVSKYAPSVNSVHYFSVLPYGLNDNAVNKKFLEEKIVKGKPYYKIEITFDEDGGGEDFEDVFIYWIDKETYMVAYLAYSYNEDDGKGMRFREAYNERLINGIRFVDYKNYKPKEPSIALYNVDEEFNKDSLELVSTIELKNISVDLIDY